MSKLRHPNLLTLVGCTISPGKFWLVTELAKYGSLAAQLKDKRDFPMEVRRLILKDAAKGLVALHANRLIHRDLKPANILLRSFSLDPDAVRAVLGDFGTARSKGTGDDTLTKCVGTISYLSPESLNAEKYGMAVDIYAMGITINETVTTESPYEDHPELTSQWKLSAAVLGGLRPTMRNICPMLESCAIACWNVDPDMRPTASQLLEMLGRPL